MSNKNRNAHLPADTNTTVHNECNTTTTMKKSVVHNSNGLTAIRLTWNRILWHFVLAAVVPFAISTVLRRQTSLFALPNDHSTQHPSVGREEPEKVCRRQVGTDSLNDNARQRRNKRVWDQHHEWSKSESSSSSLELYHETLVHPALLSHESPQQVALVVAGRTSSSDMAGSLHQVLKHTTVQHCHVLHLVVREENETENQEKHALDPNVDVSVLSSNWKDDPRVHWTTVTNLKAARTWFLDHFGSASNDNEEEEEDDDMEEITDNKLDVILLDTLLYVHAPD